MTSNENDTQRGAQASTVVLLGCPGARNWWDILPWPTLDLTAASLKQPPRKIQRLLSATPHDSPVSRDEFLRLKLYLPYGRWITKDGTKVLYNRKYQPLWVWPPDEEAYLCEPHWVDDIVEEAWFYSDGSADRVGRSKLVHTLDAVIHAWERADRADADLLETWLLGKHRTYREITEAHGADVTKRREERERFRDLMNCPA